MNAGYENLTRRQIDRNALTVFYYLLLIHPEVYHLSQFARESPIGITVVGKVCIIKLCPSCAFAPIFERICRGPQKAHAYFRQSAVPYRLTSFKSCDVQIKISPGLRLVFADTDRSLTLLTSSHNQNRERVFGEASFVFPRSQQPRDQICFFALDRYCD